MDFPYTITTKSAEETARVGKEIGNKLRTSRIICLYGELGSGKTTFVQGFARGLGITTRLLSPTFIIVRRYQTPRRFSFLYHLDLYRLSGEKELEGLGIPEILADTSSIVLIEWAEKLGDLMPEKRIDIHFMVKENGDHTIEIKKYGQKDPTSNSNP